MTPTWMAAAMTVAVLAGPVSAAAEPGGGPIGTAAARLAAVEPLQDEPGAEGEPRTAGAPDAQGDASVAQDEPRRRSRWWRVLGGAAGGAAGFYGGALIGARIEGGCNGCDDPGLKGAIIGAPIGAAVGATLGAIYFFR